MSISLARISRGHTIRELYFEVVLGLAISTWIPWTIPGSSTPLLMGGNTLNILQLIEQHDVARAVIETWVALLLSTVTV